MGLTPVLDFEKKLKTIALNFRFCIIAIIYNLPNYLSYLSYLYINLVFNRSANN